MQAERCARYLRRVARDNGREARAELARARALDEEAGQLERAHAVRDLIDEARGQAARIRREVAVQLCQADDCARTADLLDPPSPSS